MNELTYYFGAGASCKSMPLVANFKQRFLFFITYFARINTPEKRQFLEACNQFYMAVVAHLSFDTYFKKLFHQKEHNLVEKSKALILIYFIFEHLIEVPPRVGDPDKDTKQSNPDPRYEALVAGLLMPIKEKNEFYARTNFISWNYDTNLPDALRSFLYPEEKLHDFIRQRGIFPNKISLDNQVSCTHLNGLVNHPILNSGIRLNNFAMDQIMMDLIKEFTSREGELYNASKSISFCWENLYYENSELRMPPFIKGAQEAIQRSSHIVITGYSFPLYNRPVDRYLLNREIVAGKSIFIQDPRAEEIREIIENDLGIFDNSELPVVGMITTSIKTIKNCDSFFVPNNIFLQKERPHL